MKMMILTRHLLIRHAFREKCIFCVFDCIYFVNSNLKLSIDIFIMSVRHVFADFRFIFVKRSCSRRDGRKCIIIFFILFNYFIYFIKCFADIVSAHK